MNRLTGFVLLILLSAQAVAQNVGDYRSRQSGNWTNVNTWQVLDSNSNWVNASAAPNDTSAVVTIKTGDSVNLNSGARNIYSLKIDSGARLYRTTNGGNAFINLHGGDISVLGSLGFYTIDGQAQTDSISIGIMKPNCSITGTGKIGVLRIIKRSSANVSLADVRIDANVDLKWSGTSIFNEDTGFFNVIINSGASVKLLGNPGNIAIDGERGNGGSAAGGTFEINGYLEVQDTFYLRTNNGASSPYCSVIVNGHLGASHIFTSGSNGPAGFSFHLNSAARLTISGSHSAANLSNQFFTYAPGSIIEYTGNNNQLIAVPDTFSTLRLGGTGIKTFLGNAVISDTLEIQHEAEADIGSNTLQYLNGATLAYRDTLSGRITTANELPVANGPTHLITANPKGITLHQSDTFQDVTCTGASYLRIEDKTLGIRGNTRDTLYLAGSEDANLHLMDSGNMTLIRMSQTGTENRLNNFSFNRKKPIRLLNRMEVYGTVTHTADTLYTFARLFLKYESKSKYGQIAGIGSGTITGDVTMETQIDGSAGWRQLGSPFNAILNQLNDNVTLSFTPPFANCYKFDESRSVGDRWYVASGRTEAMNEKSAYAIYFQVATGTGRPLAFPALVDVRGPYRGTGNISYQNLNYTGHNPPQDDTSGWHLIPNPYPSGLRWEPNDMNGVQGDAYHLWIHGADAFDAWDGASNLIGEINELVPPFSVMYINVDSTGNNQVNINNNRRVTVPKDNYFIKKSGVPNLVALMVSGNGKRDGAVFYCDYRANEGPDRYDVRKMPNSVQNINLYFPLASNFKAAFNKVPLLSGHHYSTDLLFRAGADGNYTIWARKVENIDDGLLVFLEDVISDVCVPLPGPAYTFRYQTGEGERPFKLHFIPKSDLENKTPQEFLRLDTKANRFHVFSEPSVIVVEPKPGNNEPYTVSVYNLMGRQMLPEMLVVGGGEPWRYHIGGPEGIYIVRITRGQSVETFKVFLIR